MLMFHSQSSTLMENAIRFVSAAFRGGKCKLVKFTFINGNAVAAPSSLVFTPGSQASRPGALHCLIQVADFNSNSSATRRS